jgi:hypothetical protein
VAFLSLMVDVSRPKVHPPSTQPLAHPDTRSLTLAEVPTAQAECRQSLLDLLVYSKMEWLLKYLLQEHNSPKVHWYPVKEPTA